MEYDRPDRNPYASPGAYRARRPGEDFGSRWQSLPIDLSQGISLSGRLTPVDEQRAAAVGHDAPCRLRWRWFMLDSVVLLIIMLGIWELSQRQAVAGLALPTFPTTMARESLFVLCGSAMVLVPVFASLALVRRRPNPRVSCRYEPVEWIVGENALVALRTNRLEIFTWAEFQLHELPDMLVFDSLYDQRKLIFPRRYAHEVLDWETFIRLVRRKLPGARMTGATANSSSEGIAISQIPGERHSFLENWNGVDLNSLPRLHSSDDLPKADLMPLSTLITQWWFTWSMFAVPAVFAATASDWFRAVSSFRYFCLGVAVSYAELLVVAIWAAFRRRARMQQALDSSSPEIWSMHEDFLASCSTANRAVYLWEQLARGAETDDEKTLLVGNTNLAIVLPRRNFLPQDWRRLASRIARLPQRMDLA